MSRRIYLDAAATTPLDPAVFDAMAPVLRDEVGNASSDNWAGRRARGLIETARQQVLALAPHLNHAVFTSGATEANNLAILGLAQRRGQPTRILSCLTEHPAVLRPLDALAQQGTEVILVDVDEAGRPNLSTLEAQLGGATALVTIMAANNETGTLADLAAICRLAHAAGALVHTDASQLLAYGALSSDERPDLVTVSGHKIHGPQGVGALLMSGEAKRLLVATQLGGGQEGGLRSGTSNLAGIVGLGASAALAEAGSSLHTAHVQDLRRDLLAGLKDSFPEITVNGHATECLPGILNVSFDAYGALQADAILAQMPDVAASSGSACSSGAIGPSHVLRAMGLSDTRAESAVRFGLSRLTKDSDVVDALPMIKQAVETVRRLDEAVGNIRSNRLVQ